MNHFLTECLQLALLAFLRSGAMVLQGDMLNPATAKAVRFLLPGRGKAARAGCVLCDMAHSFRGDHSLDTYLQQELSTAGWTFAEQVLAPGGSFLVKVRHGPATFKDGAGDSESAQSVLTATELRSHMQSKFRRVVAIKPQASRSESAEHYLLGLGFRPGGYRARGGRQSDGFSA